METRLDASVWSSNLIVMRRAQISEVNKHHQKILHSLTWVPQFLRQHPTDSRPTAKRNPLHTNLNPGLGLLFVFGTANIHQHFLDLWHLAIILGTASIFQNAYSQHYLFSSHNHLWQLLFYIYFVSDDSIIHPQAFTFAYSSNSTSLKTLSFAARGFY